MTHTAERFACRAMALAVLVLCPCPVMAVGLDPVPEFYGADVEATVQRDSTSSPEFDQYIYTYKISNPSSNTGEIWYIKIDISEPVEHFDLPADPTLQLGATTKHFSDYRALLEPLGFLAGSVIPVGQKVPSGWLGGFGRDGYLGFASGKPALNIQPGQSQAGFRIESRRVPSLRWIKVIPKWVHLVPNHDAVTEEERNRAADVELKLLFTTFTLGPSSVFEQGSVEHWNQLRDDLERLINQRQCVDPGFGTKLVALLADARTALDVGDGNLAKARLQTLLDTLLPAAEALACSEGRQLVQLNAEALIASTPEKPSDTVSSEQITRPSKPQPLPGIMVIEGTATEETTRTPQRAISDDLIRFAWDGFEPGINRSIGQGDTKEKLLQRFGQPSKLDIREEPHKRDPTILHVEVYTWHWEGLEIITTRPILYEGYDKPQQYVKRITLTNPKHTLKFGLAIGAPRAAFVEKLGRSRSEEPKTLGYSTEFYAGEGGATFVHRPSISIEFDEEHRVKKITWQY